MVGKKNIRSYEVSIWTLQDSFITVLKQYGLDNMESIQEPEMILKDDGENTFSFKIPMYLRDKTSTGENSFKENPAWYTTRNGNLIANLRKIKVIFNKQTALERVFEFIINIVTEEHSGYSKYCQIQCDGLAFHELGKQGYNITLSKEEYIAECEQITNGNYPITNIDYWAHKVLDNSNWSYEVRMDWSFCPGSGRVTNKIYKDPYVASWSLNNNEIVPNEIITDSTVLEQTAIVESKESNRYNLLMKIAEAFQVFCKFEYQYDQNYHIIGRKVIFYNNFINEFDGVVDFTYGYNTSSITRAMDSNDLVSKMYVSSLSDSGVLGGEIYLKDTSINKSMEEYLLNFDYLYKIGTISQEQYVLVKEIEDELYKVNKEIQEQKRIIIECGQRIPELEASLKTAEDLQKQAEERIATAHDLYESLEEISSYTIDNPYTFTIIPSTQTGEKYINLRSDIQDIQGPIHLYREWDSSTQQVKTNTEIAAINSNSTSKITRFEYDKETGFMTRIFFTLPSNYTGQQIFGVFSYDPQGVSKKIEEIWGITKENAEIEINTLNELLGEEDKSGLRKKQKDAETIVDSKLKEKKEIINRFERLMGPALREGTWQPEDNYSKYQIPKQFTINNVLNVTGTTGMFFWDSELFYEEQKLTYKIGNNTKYYAAIDLSTAALRDWVLNHKNVYFAYRNKNYDTNISATDPRVTKYLALGAEDGCKLAFLRAKNSPNSTVKPVLLITLKTNDILTNNARICTITYSNNVMVETTNSTNITASSYWLNTSNYDIVYPRFQIDYHNFIITAPENKVLQGNTPLEEIKDYYQLYHNGKYYITIKPETLYKNLTASYKFNYFLSTAADALYLDAVKILKENSIPKVSYTMEPLAINQSFMRNAYDRIGQLIHVNDIELKFENVQGYISEVDLNLDKPWEDKYVIKNYKTKFEDLFSTIVAQTEAMQKNSQLLSMMSNAFDANGMLNDSIVQNILGQVQLEPIPTPTEIYAQYEPVIRANLKEAFNEAGKVLAAAQFSVTDVNNLNIKNAAILGSFVENIKENMTPTTFIGTTRSSADFKVGDIWENNGNVYLATQNSKQLYPNGYPSDILTSLKGWTLTQNGKLAGITGTVIDIDAKAGNISLKATNKIEVLAKTQLDLAANDVFITGNNSVNIGSKWVNIAGTNGGINIVTSNINTSTTKNSDGTVSGTSAVKMDQNGIIIAANAGIKIKSATGIDIYTSDTTTTSAISISREHGIWLGSNQPITFYSGSSGAVNDSAASMLISKDRILFGVSDKTTTGTAIDLTKNRIVIGAGADINGSNIENIGLSATGIKITKDAIDFAAGNNNVRSYLHLAKDQILISNTSSSSTGAQVSISQSGVIIGTVSKATNSNKTGFIDKIQSGVQATDSSTATFQVYAPNFVVDASGHLYAYDADITGKIRASSLTIGGKSSEKYVKDTIDNSISSGAIKTFVESVENDLQSQIDGEIDTWFFVGAPVPQTNGTARLSTTLEKEWGITWTANTGYNNASKLIILRHNSDVYYDIGVTTQGSTDYSATAGRAYRFIAKETTSGNISTLKYYWSEISDTATTDALKQAAQAQATADGKITTYYGTGTPTKTDAADGDLYINSTDNEVFRFNASTKKWVSIRDQAFYLKTFFDVDENSGIIRGGAHKTDPITGKIFEGANIVLDNNGYIELSSMKDSKDIAKLTLDANGNIILSSGNKTVGNSNLKLTPTSVSITSGGVFNVDSTNFYVKSNAGSGNINFRLGSSSSPDLSYTIGKGLTVKGAITATSFELDGAKIKQSDVNGLTDALNNITSTGATIRYAISSNGTDATQIAASDWKTTIPSVSATDTKRYLWTRTVVTYASGQNPSTSYSVSYIAKDGEAAAQGAPGKYVTEITSLYWLSNTTVTNSNKPTSKITSTSDSTGGWRIIVPTYQNGYTYYRCEQYKWSDGQFFWSDVYEDNGLTIANSKATSASTEAQRLVNGLNALAPHTFSGNGTYSNYTLLGKTYGLALTSANSLLIGANNGITVVNADESATAVVIDKNGIALNAASIQLKATSNATTNVVQLDEDGITLAATKNLIIKTGNFKVDNGNVQMSGTITATGGSIGGWLINPTVSTSNSNKAAALVYCPANKYLEEATMGIFPGTASTVALWIGGTRSANQVNGVAQAPFRVTKAGKLYATGAVINGSTTITANNVNITGTANSSFTVDMTNFKVASNGDVTIKGEINATKGSIAKWTITSNYIGSANIRGNSRVGMACVGDGNSDFNTVDEDETQTDGSEAFCAFWAGGQKNASRGDFFLDPKETAFYVRKSGSVHITKGEINSNYLGSISATGLKYRIYVSSSTPTTDAFNGSDRLKRMSPDRLLWIQPSGSSTTKDGVKRTECKVYWCELTT